MFTMDEFERIKLQQETWRREEAEHVQACRDAVVAAAMAWHNGDYDCPDKAALALTDACASLADATN